MLVLLHALSAAIVLSRSVPYGSVPRLLGARHVQPPPLLAHASASSTEKVRCGTPVLSGASLDSAGGPQLPWRQTDDATAAANANATAQKRRPDTACKAHRTTPIRTCRGRGGAGCHRREASKA